MLTCARCWKAIRKKAATPDLEVCEYHVANNQHGLTRLSKRGTQAGMSSDPTGVMPAVSWDRRRPFCGISGMQQQLRFGRCRRHGERADGDDQALSACGSLFDRQGAGHGDGFSVEFIRL